MITHESWKRIKEIFQSAQELSPAERPEFLDRACGNDKSLREEVEALLTADASNDDFLSVPAYEFAAEIIAGEETEFSAGQKVGRYTILCPLGAGGMGQIYLAEDSQLSRRIALKLISPQFANDSRRVERFEQEARAASALNHPNICVIHDLGKTEHGRNFIAMEYIQGVTLRDKVLRGPLTVRQALNLALQVADALSATHATHIVHRDIKPENIMVRPDGYVKVLDFGLAKLTEVFPQGDGAPANVHSEMGMLMGTVKYMSPEQLRDTRVDERTDIWSLGVVLYEMLTGVTPFEAKSSNDTVAAILNSQPPPLKFPRNVPRELQDAIARALHKDRERRYQTVAKLATDLKLLRSKLLKHSNSALDLYPVQGDEQLTRQIERHGIFARLKTQAISTTDFLLTGVRSHKKAAVFTGATSVLVFLLFLPTGTRLIRSLINPPSQQTMTYVTNAGTSVFAAISPDGRWIVHTEERGENQRLILINTATSTPSEITAATNVRYAGITFSQDGNWLYFTRFENGNGSAYRLAVPGGVPPMKIKDNVDSPISLSPQEDRFAFVRLDQGETVYSLIVSTIDGVEQVLGTRRGGDTFSVYGLQWSPDGTVVVCPVGSWSDTYTVKLMAVDVGTQSARIIGDHSWHGILEIAWQDMSGFIVSGKDQGSDPFRLWRITYPDGERKQLTRDLAEYRGVSLFGQDIVTVRTEWSWDLVVIDRETSFPRSRTIASAVGLTYGLAWAGNQRLLFSGMAEDRLNIWRIDADGTNQVKLPGQLNDNYSPVSSADGRFVVFSSNRTGKFNIWRMNTEDGSDLKQLTFTNGNFYPHVSSDNKWVIYDNQQKGQLSIWKAPLEGGDAIKIIDRYRMPVFSPDNELIAARYDSESGTNDAAIFLASGGEPIERFGIPRFDWQRVDWLSQNTLTYVDKSDGYPNIWSYERYWGVRKQLTHFTRNHIFAYRWSPDKSQLAVQLGNKTSNVVRIKNGW